MSRIRLSHTEAIVLKRHDLGEADRILTLYTPDRGKLRAVAKGVRRIASRKSGHVELFMHAGVMLAEGRNLDVVTQAETIRSFRRVREDLVRTTYAYHISEVLDRFVEEGSPSPATFALLGDALAALDAADDPSLVARFFELRLLGHLGYRPSLFTCVSCRAELLPGGNAFAPEAGGVTCPECSPHHPGVIALDEAAFRVLRFLQTREWSVVRRLAVAPRTTRTLERVMHAYIRILLERDLKSVEFLQGLRKVAAAIDLHHPPAGETDGASAAI